MNQTQSLIGLVRDIKKVILSARSQIVKNINLVQVQVNFEIGRQIVEYEQKGSKRAQYGKKILEDLAQRLSTELGAGFSERNLRHMRKFYLTYQDRLAQIRQMPSAEFSAGTKYLDSSRKISLQTATPFKLSWSQYVFLIGIKDNGARRFYEIEATNNNWTLPELVRQFNSGLYERLALSRNKEGVRKLAKEGQVIGKHQDLLKEPYVFEFLGIDEKTKYSESDLETAIINKIEHFLLELGKGFLFESRQKRFTFDEDH